MMVQMRNESLFVHRARGVLALAAIGVTGLSVAVLGQPAGVPAVPAVASAQPERAWADVAPGFSDLEWITRPPRDSIMSFTISVEVTEIPVKPGDRVKKGQLLVKARDAEALAGLEVQRVRAANEGEVLSARASLELAEVRYRRIRDADAEGATNPQEVDERRVQVDASRAALTAAEMRLVEERERLKQLAESVKRYRIEAPYDGIVETLAIDEGSTVEPPAPVLRIVAIDTLWVDLPVSTSLTLARGIQQGHPAWVLLDVPGLPVVQGTVLHVSPVADAAAETRRVRVEIPNQRGLPPGTRARVRFDAPAAVAASGGLPGADARAANENGAAR